MHSLLAALNRGEGFTPNSARKSAGFNVSGEFAAFFNRSVANAAGGPSSAAQDLLARLRERFPKAKIAEQDVAPGLEESKKAAGADGDKQSDKVNLSSALLEEMGLDAGLADKIEAMLSGLFDNFGGGAATPPGSYVQRSVSLTVTTVRYTELLRTDAEGSVLAAAELQTALRDRIDEMLADLSGALDAAFGRRGKEPGSAESAESGESSGAQNSPARKQFGGSFAGLWSMELFYSTATVAHSVGNSAGSAEASWEAASFSGGYSSFSGYGTWGGLTGGSLPSFLAQMLEGGAGGNGGQAGGVSNFLDEALAGSGVSLAGYRQIETGFSFKFAASRNLIEELMELYGERLDGGRRDGSDGESTSAADDAAADTATDDNAAAGESGATAAASEAAYAV